MFKQQQQPTTNITAFSLTDSSSKETTTTKSQIKKFRYFEAFFSFSFLSLLNSVFIIFFRAFLSIRILCSICIVHMG